MCPFMVRYEAATLTCEMYCRHFYFFGNHIKSDIFRQPLTVRFSLFVGYLLDFMFFRTSSHGTCTVSLLSKNSFGFKQFQCTKIYFIPLI